VRSCTGRCWRDPWQRGQRRWRPGRPNDSHSDKTYASVLIILVLCEGGTGVERTLPQMLQLHSAVPLNVSSIGLLLSDMVTAPQWQEPVYNLCSSAPPMAVGSGPSCSGGTYGSPSAAPSNLLTVSAGLFKFLLFNVRLLLQRPCVNALYCADLLGVFISTRFLEREMRLSSIRSEVDAPPRRILP
jgi:hypothetical protein